MANIHESCCCFGHSKIEITENLKNNLRATFEDLIMNKGVNCFYFGGFGEFDNLCWKIVTELKSKYSSLYRIFCLSDRRHLRYSKRPHWIKDENFEEITYLELDFDYWYTRIYFRNCEIINRSEYVVFYVDHIENSGAYKMFQYAQKKKKQIINLGNLEV